MFIDDMQAKDIIYILLDSAIREGYVPGEWRICECQGIASMEKGGIGSQWFVMHEGK